MCEFRPLKEAIKIWRLNHSWAHIWPSAFMEKNRLSIWRMWLQNVSAGSPTGQNSGSFRLWRLLTYSPSHLEIKIRGQHIPGSSGFRQSSNIQPHHLWAGCLAKLPKFSEPLCFQNPFQQISSEDQKKKHYHKVKSSPFSVLWFFKLYYHPSSQKLCHFHYPIPPNG